MTDTKSNVLCLNECLYLWVYYFLLFLLLTFLLFLLLLFSLLALLFSFRCSVWINFILSSIFVIFKKFWGIEETSPLICRCVVMATFWRRVFFFSLNLSNSFTGSGFLYNTLCKSHYAVVLLVNIVRVVYNISKFFHVRMSC